MAGDDAGYESKSVLVIRGTEAKTASKWQADGWELVAQNPGLVRTELTFRRSMQKKSMWPRRALVAAMLAVVVSVSIGVIHERSASSTPEAAETIKPSEFAATASPAPTTRSAPQATNQATTAQASKPSQATTPTRGLEMWTKADGSQRIRCTANDGSSAVTFTLPAQSPITRELNSILHEFDGRKPVTVLTVTHDLSVTQEGRDETSSLFRGLSFDTPTGRIESNSENGAYDVLEDTRLTFRHSEVGTKRLRARAVALQNRISDDWSKHDVTYLVLERPLTRVDSAQGDFWEGSLGGCMVV